MKVYIPHKFIFYLHDSISALTEDNLYSVNVDNIVYENLCIVYR